MDLPGMTYASWTTVSPNIMAYYQDGQYGLENSSSDLSTRCSGYIIVRIALRN